MMKEKISIIVPVYNVEAYLERCVESSFKTDLYESGNSSCQ